MGAEYHSMQLRSAMSELHACWCTDCSDRLCVPKQAPAVAADAAPHPDEPHAPAMAFNGDHIQQLQQQQQQHGPLRDAAEQVNASQMPLSCQTHPGIRAKAGVGSMYTPQGSASARIQKISTQMLSRRPQQ